MESKETKESKEMDQKCFDDEKKVFNCASSEDEKNSSEEDQWNGNWTEDCSDEEDCHIGIVMDGDIIVKIYEDGVSVSLYPGSPCIDVFRSGDKLYPKVTINRNALKVFIDYAYKWNDGLFRDISEPASIEVEKGFISTVYLDFDKKFHRTNGPAYRQAGYFSDFIQWWDHGILLTEKGEDEYGMYVKDFITKKLALEIDCKLPCIRSDGSVDWFFYEPANEDEDEDFEGLCRQVKIVPKPRYR